MNRSPYRCLIKSRGCSCQMRRGMFVAMMCRVARIGRERLMPDPDRIFYGLIVVIVGLTAVTAGYLIALYTNKLPAEHVATALASFGGVIGTIVGTFFGLHHGAAGKEKAERQRDKALKIALMLSGRAPEDKFELLLKDHPDLLQD